MSWDPEGDEATWERWEFERQMKTWACEAAARQLMRALADALYSYRICDAYGLTLVPFDD